MAKLKNEDAYDELFKKFAKETNNDWLLLKAQVKQESGFNPKAISRVGAKGLSQFMDRTWLEWQDGTPGVQDLLVKYDPYNPEHNLKAQAYYMQWLRKQVIKITKTPDYAIEWVLSAYNWGIGFVTSALRTSTNYYTMEPKLPSETQTYVRHILKFYKEYISAKTDN